MGKKADQKQADIVEAILSGTKTADMVRQIVWDREQYQTNCCTKCPGWIIADSCERGLEIQRCDDCNSYYGEASDHFLTDDDVRQLPEAQRALRKAIKDAQRNDNRARRTPR